MITKFYKVFLGTRLVLLMFYRSTKFHGNVFAWFWKMLSFTLSVFGKTLPRLSGSPPLIQLCIYKDNSSNLVYVAHHLNLILQSKRCKHLHFSGYQVFCSHRNCSTLKIYAKEMRAKPESCFLHNKLSLKETICTLTVCIELWPASPDVTFSSAICIELFRQFRIFCSFHLGPASSYMTQSRERDLKFQDLLVRPQALTPQGCPGPPATSHLKMSSLHNGVFNNWEQICEHEVSQDLEIQRRRSSRRSVNSENEFSSFAMPLFLYLGLNIEENGGRSLTFVSGAALACLSLQKYVFLVFLLGR